MEDAYRTAPGEALALLDGKDLVVRPGAALPRVCLLCGKRKKLNDRELRFENRGGGLVVGPVWLVLAVTIIGALHREVTKDVPVPPPLAYTCCTPCERRATDARQLTPAIWLGFGILVLGAATAGFNGAPILGVAILVIAAVGAWLAHRTFLRGRSFSARLRENGVALRGIHGDAAQAMLVTRRVVPSTTE